MINTYFIAKLSEKTWCVNKRVNEICGCPVVKEIYRGNLKQCEELIKKILIKEMNK